MSTDTDSTGIMSTGSLSGVSLATVRREKGCDAVATIGGDGMLLRGAGHTIVGVKQGIDET